MQKIIVINGTGGSGKDTFIDFCKLYIPVFNTSTVDEVKIIATEFFNWNGGKTEKDRKMLSDLKALWGDYCDGPYQYIKNIIGDFYGTVEKGILFIHSREPEELDRFKKEFGVLTLLIRNNRIEPILTNDSDANIENYKYDYIIDNNGNLKDLLQSAADFIVNLQEEK
jgi:hypothetical protein